MSNHKSVYLMLGVRLSDDDLKARGFEGRYDDRLMPFIEDRPGAAFEIITGESDDIFAGIVLAHGGEYDSDDVCDIIPLEFDYIRVSRELTLAGLHVKPEQVHLYFFDMWS